MIVIGTYDISEDNLRSQVAALFQAFGDRIQKSVFVLDVDHKELEGLRGRVDNLIKPETDSVYFFHQCANCWENLNTHGQADPPKPVLLWAVL